MYIHSSPVFMTIMCVLCIFATIFKYRNDRKMLTMSEEY